MARRTNRRHDGPGLFEEQEQHLARRIRRQRALFIPRFLSEAASNLQLRGAAEDKAHEIALRWADLETNGHLPKYKETSIDTQFLYQLFGEGLGYQQVPLVEEGNARTLDQRARPETLLHGRRHDPSRPGLQLQGLAW